MNYSHRNRCKTSNVQRQQLISHNGQKDVRDDIGNKDGTGPFYGELNIRILTPCGSQCRVCIDLRILCKNSNDNSKYLLSAYCIAGTKLNP